MRLDKIGVIVFSLCTSLLCFGQIWAEKTQIERSLGLELINPLLDGFQVNTTTLRMEEKNILKKTDVDKHLKPFLEDTSDKKQIHFELRDKSLKNQRSKTTTLYGKKIFFWNDTVKTNIKVRARVYSQQNEDGSYQRINKLKDKFFLELKVKNATPQEFNISRKYRFLIKDEVLKQLFSLKVEDPNFSKKLKALGNLLKADNPKKTEEQLAIFIKTIKEFSLIDEEFIRPLYAVTYSRKGYKYVENYSKKKHFKRKKNKKEGKKVEYQITLDQDIKVFEIDRPLFAKKSIQEYLDQDLNKKALYNYSPKLCFLEFKSPMNAKNRSYQKHSSHFKQLKHDFFTPLFEIVNAYGSYEKNKGKLASAMKALREKAKEEGEEESV